MHILHIQFRMENIKEPLYVGGCETVNVSDFFFIIQKVMPLKMNFLQH